MTCASSYIVNVLFKVLDSLINFLSSWWLQETGLAMSLEGLFVGFLPLLSDAILNLVAIVRVRFRVHARDVLGLGSNMKSCMVGA